MVQPQVLQFKITLKETNPIIWRRIQISELCSFWDLHVAIQDAMGWLDCHLHHFEVNHPIETGKQYMGIPTDEDHDVLNTLPGWEYKVKDYLIINPKMIYEYDYGDGWTHEIVFEGLHNKQPSQQYPVCLAGERKCPPEDVGGTHGFEEFLRVIADPNDDEHESSLEWVGGKYDPDDFTPSKVKFDNPTKRWKRAFQESIGC